LGGKVTRPSIFLGVLGLFVTGVALPYLSRWGFNAGPRQHWLLELAALFPAWLVAFLALLPHSLEQGARAPLPRSAFLSSAIALFGVVFADIAVRMLDKSGYALSPFKYWVLGAAGLFPAWLITLWILL
jgi:hypothetical protein